MERLRRNNDPEWPALLDRRRGRRVDLWRSRKLTSCACRSNRLQPEYGKLQVGNSDHYVWQHHISRQFPGGQSLGQPERVRGSVPNLDGIPCESRGRLSPPPCLST